MSVAADSKGDVYFAGLFGPRYSDQQRIYRLRGASVAPVANMQIVNQYKRPVLNRTEKDKQAYAEIIFHLKGK